jgi:hypothetical protein
MIMPKSDVKPTPRSEPRRRFDAAHPLIHDGILDVRYDRERKADRCNLPATNV